MQRGRWDFDKGGKLAPLRGGSKLASWRVSYAGLGAGCCSMDTGNSRLSRSWMMFAAAWMVFAGTVVHGQAGAGGSAASPQAGSAPAGVARFDVAAIHQNIDDRSGHNHIYSSPNDGHFRAVNVSAKMLVRWAFEMPETRILGGPAWMNSTMFDIDATADSVVDAQMAGLNSAVGRQEKERMVRALLGERFKLVSHIETRELPIYALVAAKGGPKLGAIQTGGTTINTGRARMEVQGSNSIALLAEELAKIVGRVVVDKTGVEGRYDLKLSWTPDDGAASVVNGSGGSSATADSGPSIFTSIEEQLGLKLESRKGPVEVLVIDHAEMPSEN